MLTRNGFRLINKIYAYNFRCVMANVASSIFSQKNSKFSIFFNKKDGKVMLSNILICYVVWAKLDRPVLHLIAVCINRFVMCYVYIVTSLH